MTAAMNPEMTTEQALTVISNDRPMPPVKEDIALYYLDIDPRYQRGIDPRHVATIAKDFDELGFGVLYVSERRDAFSSSARYVIIDGQHRAEAAKRALGSSARVPCMVYRGLDERQEAALFVLMNNKRLSMSAMNQFKAQLFSGDPEAIAINDIVTNVGLKIQFNADKTPEAIHAVGALRTVYRMKTDRQKRERDTSPVFASGGELLRVTLQTIRSAWFPQEGVYSSDAVQGVAVFLNHFGDAVDRSRLVRCMQRDGVNLMQQRARALKDINQERLSQSFAKVLAGSYNLNLRSSRLPEWGTQD